MLGRIELPLPSGAKLVKAEVRLTQTRGEEWIRQIGDVNSEIRLDEVLDGAPRLPARLSRTVLAAAFGQSPAIVRHYAGCLAASALRKEFPDTLCAVNFLSQELGLNFRKEFAGHLGGFDLFLIRPPFDGATPFHWQVAQVCGTKLFRLFRVDAGSGLTVRVRMECLGETVTQRLVRWENGNTTLDLSMDDNVDNISVEVYDFESGDLIYQDECGFTMEVHLSLGLAGRTLQHQDALSNRAISLGDQAVRRASQTTTQARQLVSVGVTDLRTQITALRRVVEQTTERSADRWFARGVGEELDVIDHINTLLNDIQVKRAILVDPFFGEEALRRFILRVQNSDLSLSVITSWGHTDPDTAQPVSDRARPNYERLGDLIQAITPVIACNLSVLNLVTGSGEQAFHDRYLAVYRQDGECLIWLLSNSINAMAMNWPFCMSQLTGLARWHAQRYLEGLESGNDLTSSKTLTVTYQRPGNQ
jgi:hypothetical protein